MSEIEEAVRRWARGLYPAEAGVELLLRQELAIYDGAPWIRHEGGYAAIDPEALLDQTAGWSGGERRLVAIAASLLGGPAVDLSDAMSGLDRHHASLVLAALAHANGSHQHARMVVDHARGVMRRDGFEPSLYAWPAGT